MPARCPDGIRGNVHNVLTNLGGPVNVANDLLEAEFTYAGEAGARFIINTTIGVVGIFDVATDWGLPERSRDFGETLGIYGIGQGPYLVLPFRGPTSVRDFAGGYVDGYFSPLHFVHYTGSTYVGLVKSSLGSVDNRSANIVTYRDIERASVDYYATMRAYYRQRASARWRTRRFRPRNFPTFRTARNRLSIAGHARRPNHPDHRAHRRLLLPLAGLGDLGGAGSGGSGRRLTPAPISP